MGIQGQYVDTFVEGNIASCVDTHMNADYPHFFFDVVGTQGPRVTLQSHHSAQQFEFPIRRDKSGKEYAVISQVSTYERLFRGGKPAKFRIYPMKGHRF